MGFMVSELRLGYMLISAKVELKVKVTLQPDHI